MRMCGTELMRRSVWSTKGDWDIKLSARHGVHIRSVVNDLIECNERKTERHKLDDWPQADHCCTNPQTGKPVFTDWSINNPPRPEPLEQPVADLVGSLIFRYFLAHQKNI